MPLYDYDFCPASDIFGNQFAETGQIPPCSSRAVIIPRVSGQAYSEFRIPDDTAAFLTAEELQKVYELINGLNELITEKSLKNVPCQEVWMSKVFGIPQFLWVLPPICCLGGCCIVSSAGDKRMLDLAAEIHCQMDTFSQEFDGRFIWRFRRGRHRVHNVTKAAFWLEMERVSKSEISASGGSSVSELHESEPVKGDDQRAKITTSPISPHPGHSSGSQ